MVGNAITQSLNRSSNIWRIDQWNSKIRQCVKQGHAHQAIILFRQMKQNGEQPNNLTFPLVAKACAKLSDLGCSQILHTHVVKSPFCTDIFVQTSMIDMYVKCDHIGYAYKLFEVMGARDVISWNAMLVGFTQSSFPHRALSLFREMRLARTDPDPITVMGLTGAASQLKNLKLVKAIHSMGIQTGVDADVRVANTWVSAYSKCGELVSANTVFDDIEEGLRTVVSWNSMISGYANFNKFTDAFVCYKQMLCSGLNPDISTFVSLLSSCAQPEAIFFGKLIHSHGTKLGYDSESSICNTLVSMYSKCEDINSARQVFDGMLLRTRVAWNAMITGFAEKGDVDEMLALFHAMEEAGEKPDSFTVVSLVLGCSQAGALELGKWVDGFATSNGLKGNTTIRNALIDMYAKCGSMDNAKKLFHAMDETERTVVSWTTMITGCALNGEFEESLRLFSQMVDAGIKPNHVTFLAVLQSCSHGGFLEKGWECFNLMTRKHNITPGLSHYSCMVDLLGRKGRLKEALQFIQSMPVKPDAAVWSALLGACKVHSDAETGEYVAARLFELDPQVAAPYVEMANIYASAGRWDGVARMRTMMKLSKARKSPGQSLVHVNGKTCVFTAEDKGNLEDLIVCEVLDVIGLHSKEERSLQLCDEVLECDVSQSAYLQK